MAKNRPRFQTSRPVRREGKVRNRTLSVPQSVNPTPLKAPVLHQSGPGPWGRLEYYDTYLEAPDRLLDQLSLPSEQTVWNFFDFTRDQILDLFKQAELAPSQIESLSRAETWRVQGRQYRIFPAPEIVESLSPQSRATIYRTLATWTENPLHRDPMVFDRRDLFQVLDRSDLPEPLIAQIARLVYEERGVTLFSDFPLLLRQLTHPHFERRLIRILTRTRTQILRLQISENDNLDDLADYWTAGRRHFRSLPLLRAIVSTLGTGCLDIAHFLPQTARAQLFTYPNVADVAVDGRAPDSVWTAINFMRNNPMAIYLDTPGAVDQLRTTHQIVSAPYSFGDVILLSSREDETLCHACIYIADDIVFTKPNASFFTPWIFAKLPDVLAVQARGFHSVGMTGYRSLGQS